MNILVSPRFSNELKAIMTRLHTQNPAEAKRFKLYLETILLNLPSKAHKYKPSIYFDTDTVRDIEHQGYTIPFYNDSENSTFVILGIIDNRSTSE